MALSLLKIVADKLTRGTKSTPEQIRSLIQSGQFSAAQKGITQLPRDSLSIAVERLCLEGELYFQMNKDEEAESKFREALLMSPSSATAHCGLSTVLAAQGDIDLAIMHAHFAVDSTGRKDAKALAQLGYCQLLAGNLAAAEHPLRISTALDVTNPYAWNNLGIIAAAQGKKNQAIRYFEKALQLKPAFESAIHHLASAQSIESEVSAEDDIGPALQQIKRDDETLSKLLDNDQLHEALAHLERECIADPRSIEKQLALSQLQERMGYARDGIENLEKWLLEEPNNEQARREIGLAYARLQEAKLAERWLTSLPRETIEQDAEVIKSLAGALSAQEKYDEASILYELLCKIEPTDSNFGAKAANLCNACRYDEALKICEGLVAKGAPAPGYGATLTFLGRFDEALSVINRGLERQPNDPNLRMFKGQIALLKQDFEEGWVNYAYRHYANHARVRALPFKLWRGEPLAGKSILVLAEQGLGDQIMFASCLPDLQAQNPARVVVESIDRISSTLARSFPEIEFVATKQNNNIDFVRSHPNIDYFAHLGDLPQKFRKNLDSFPHHTGYLKPEPSKVKRWKIDIAEWESIHLPQCSKRLRIGFSWRGGTPGTRSPVRTLTSNVPRELDPSRNATWVCLQYGSADEDIKRLNDSGFPVAYWPNSIADLDEFAALISSLDLVITVCNTTVHYAGALGTPVWIMAPKIPEWRYGLNNHTMPWYPSSVIFRQEQLGEWDTVFAEIKQRLAETTKIDSSHQD